MIFSKLGRCLTRSSSRSNSLLYGGGVRSAIVGGGIPRLPRVTDGLVDGRLGVLRGYLAAIGAKNESNLWDLNHVLANPGIYRFFSSESPKNKKNFENFYPKEKKEIPKEDEQKSESKEDSNTDDHGNFQDTFMKQFQNLITPLLVIALFLSSFSLSPREQQQISFQEFKNKLLEPGLVDHIVVSNKSVAKVFVRSSPHNQTIEDDFHGPVSGTPSKGHGGQYKYYFNIGSVEAFEEKLEEAQETLGIDPHDFVPVTYVSEMVWYNELMRFAPTLLLLGTLMYMVDRKSVV